MRWWLGIAVLALTGGCALLGLGAVPCADDGNCPSGQVCGADKVCAAGARDAGGAIDAAAADGRVEDAAVVDGATAIDAASVDVSAPDTQVADSASPDAAGADAGGVDAGPGCESPPCLHMPDSPTRVCRDSDTTTATCPGAGDDMYGQDGCYLLPAPDAVDLGTGVVDDRLSGLQWQQAVASPSRRNVADAIAYCADLNLGGNDDWRLPTFTELVTLLDLGKTYPAAMLDSSLFPTPANLPFWSASGYGGYHWTLDFFFGDASVEIDTLGYGDGFAVRCVRGAPHVGGDVRFTAGTYVDRRSALQWQAQPPSGLTWQEAAAGCEALQLAGHDDWRLPTLKELETLVDRSRDPGSDPFAYPAMVADTALAEYWTSTPALSDYGFYAVLFGSAQYTNRYRSGDRTARCVRGP
jgi:hypothetical protein